jgi:membrane protein YfhO
VARASQPASWWRHPRPSLLGAFGIFLLAALVYAPGLGPDRAPITFDTVAFFYPLRHYLALAWQHGRWLPLWTSDVFMGVPFLANIQNAVLYPPNLIYAVFPTGRALAISMVLHAGIAGAGMYLYTYRGLRLRATAAAVAAVIYMLGPYMTAHLTHLDQNNTLAWTPWLMLAADRLVLRPRPRMIVVVALLVALTFLAGHTQQFYLALLLALLALVSRFLRMPGLGLRRAAARLGALMAAIVLGLGVGGLQLIPTLELTSHSIRSGGFDLASEAILALPLKGAMGSFLPKYSIELPTEFAGASIGAVALFLMSVAVILRWRRTAVSLWIAVFVVAAWASTGPTGRLYDALFFGLPGLGLFRVPARLLLFSTVAGALMSAYGVHAACQLTAVARRDGRWRRKVAAAVVPPSALALVLPAAAVVDRLVPGQFPRPLRMLPHQIGTQDITIIVGFELAAALLIFLAIFSPFRVAPWIVGLSLAALTLVDISLATAHIDARHPLPMALLSFQPAASTFLPPGPNQRYLALYRPRAGFQGQTQLYRGVASTDLAKLTEAAQVEEVLRPDAGMSSGSLTPDGYDGGILPLRAYAEFRKPVLGASAIAPPDFTIHDLIDRVSDPAWLREAGVGVVLTDAGTYPAAVNCQCFTLVGTVDGVSAWALSGGATRAWVIGPQGRRPATIVADSGEELQIALQDRAGGSLVLADAAYPGWSATVDGRAAAIETYDGFLRAVRVPAGAAQVVFSYRPASLLLGAALSAISLAVVITLLLLSFPRPR